MSEPSFEGMLSLLEGMLLAYNAPDRAFSALYWMRDQVRAGLVLSANQSNNVTCAPKPAKNDAQQQGVVSIARGEAEKWPAQHGSFDCHGRYRDAEAVRSGAEKVEGEASDSVGTGLPSPTRRRVLWTADDEKKVCALLEKKADISSIHDQFPTRSYSSIYSLVSRLKQEGRA